MDINSILRGVVNNASKGLTDLDNTTRKTDGKSLDASVATFAKNEEKVTLTSAASRLGELAQQASNQPEVNAERVASLRAAIAEGNYKPNPASIAARLMTFENQIKG
ncbi:MAG: flagellar biosynthesis anti-sigma factor FlgM [Gammaproteobacteria bacterium]|nr:flagellar biosynthesis anti-sigma factor FlgM [Gammaproteobacteria bacterium]